MSSIVGKIAIFTAGAAVGSAVTWKLIKEKYEQMAREDIQSVRDYYANKYKEVEETPDETPEEEEDDEEVDQFDVEDELEDYYELVDSLGYGGDNHISGKGGSEQSDDPRVITPDEFAELDNYEVRSLLYFADGVLTDDDNNIIEDVDSLVGKDALTHFGEYEDDSVFVRNDELATDFEILLEPRHYKDLYPDREN